MVDADAVHPRDPLTRRRVVLRVEDHGAASFLGQLREAGQQGAAVRAMSGRERAQEVAGDAVREELDAARQSVEPGLERVLAGRKRADFPVRVDVDDGHERPPFAGARAPV
jgi:hypothetical protein